MRIFPKGPFVEWPPLLQQDIDDSHISAFQRIKLVVLRVEERLWEGTEEDEKNDVEARPLSFMMTPDLRFYLRAHGTSISAAQKSIEPALV